MSTDARIDKSYVLATPGIGERAIDRYGIPGKRSGRWFRTKSCPACGPRTRPDAVAINLDDGHWICHPHGCTGDVFALVAHFAGLDTRRQFPQVLELAAEMAGIVGAELSPSDKRRLRRQRELLDRDRRAQEAADRAARRTDAIGRASARWATLQVRSEAGEAYLEQRGVGDARKLGLVRFTRGGDIAIGLRGVDRQLVNVVTRRRVVVGDEPKVLGMAGCQSAGTFVDAVADITHGRDVVLVEGLFDALTARLAWPDAVILGGHGATNIPKIAAAAVPRIRLARTRLLLVPHADDAGEQSMIAAGRFALAAGLRHGADLLVVDCEAKDLNDGWCAGWRPTT
jgi:hypothetical protein